MNNQPGKRVKSDTQRTFSPFRKLMGIEEEWLGEGAATIFMDIRPELLQNQGYVHGGALASFIDMAHGSAMYTTLNDHQHAVTVEQKVNYIRPGKGSRLKAIAEVVNRGQTLCYVRSNVYDEEGKLICSGNGTFYIVNLSENVNE